MAIFHLHAQIIKRSAGRSAVAAAAYRAGEKLHNDYDGITYDFTRKSGVVHTEIMLPENAPKEYSDRSALWNAVEKAEKRKDAQTAREIDIALPVEFDRAEQIETLREYIQNNFTQQGMCVDFAIHNKQDGNPHAHIMLTTRKATADGFGDKNRDWNKTELLEQWREKWTHICNKRLQAKGTDERIDHRTLKAQGINREPTIHIGAIAKAMEKAGRDSDRVKMNKEIVTQNKRKMPEITAEYMHELKQGYIILDREITALPQKSVEIRTALVTEKDIFRLEYQKQKLLAGVNPNGQQMQKELELLDKKSSLNLSVKEKLAFTRCQHIFEVVPERSFQRILDDLQPEQAYKLIKQRERERVRKFEHIRYR